MVRLLLLLVGLLTALPAFAQNVYVQLEPPRLQVGQTGRMTILFVGEKTRGAPQFDPPDNVRVDFDGSFTRFQTRGFDRFLVYAYRYRVTPLEEGEIELGGWEFELTNKKKVKAQTAVLVSAPREALEFDEFQVDAGFDVEEAWEGQVVVYDYEMVAKVPVLAVDWRHPEFEGLRPTTSGNRVERNYTIENPDGGVIEVIGGTIPLVAAGTGDLTQPGSLASARISRGGGGRIGFQNYRTKQVVTDGAPLFVRPVPVPPDKYANYSGLVGEFEVRSRLDKTKAAVGESITWTLDIAGNGSLDGWDPPELADLDGITVYDNDGEVDARIRDGRYAAQGRFSRVLVAAEPGIYELPAFDLVIFSPKRGGFATIRVSKPGTLEITKGRDQDVDVESFAGEGGTDATTEEIDFRGVYTWGMSRTVPVSPVASATSGAMALPAFLVLLMAFVERLRERWEARKQARVRPPTAAERLRYLPEDRMERLAALDAAFRQALADREGVELVRLDRDAAIDALPDAIKAFARDVSRKLDRARFAAGPATGLEEQIRDLVKEIGRS